MQWKKIWYFQLPKRKYDWMVSHAQLPTPLYLGDKKLRVFFATRDEANRSSVAFVDLKIAARGENVELLKISERPVLRNGDLGTFDEHGVYPSCVIKHLDEYLMYFIGWNKGSEAPMFYSSIGLARSIDGESFEKDSPAPILARSAHDPCLVTSPHVYADKEKLRMSYVSGVKWSRKSDGSLQSHYHIKLATGTDPKTWIRNGDIAIDFNEGETNIARPSVFRDNNYGYHMWYSYVHKEHLKYRIGYARSNDGCRWHRRDEVAGIEIGDILCNEMICYPAIFAIENDLYMLFNGDGFGKEGFGLARLMGGLPA